MINRKKIKSLQIQINDLSNKVAVLNFKLCANGDKYIAKHSWTGCMRGSYKEIVVEFVYKNSVQCNYLRHGYDVMKPKVVGDYVEVYRNVGDNCPVTPPLIAVYTQLDDQMVSVDLEMYKKAKAYDEGACCSCEKLNQKRTDEKEKTNENP